MLLSRRSLIQGLSAFAIGSAFATTYASQDASFPLWEVRHKGKKVYLLAHTPPRAVAWKDERAQRLLTGCGHYWNETGHHSEANIQDLMQQYGIDHHLTLESHLDRAQRAKVRRYR